MEGLYSIKVYKEYFNFSSSHFLIFKDGSREPLHGHNYRVKIQGKAMELDSDMVFDFLDIKPIVKEVCDTLDHKLMLPQENPHIKYEVAEGSCKITCPDQSQFSIPEQDIIFLPIPNTSAERLAIYLSKEISELVSKRFKFSFSELEIEVEETPGQSAIYVYKGE